MAVDGAVKYHAVSMKIGKQQRLVGRLTVVSQCGGYPQLGHVELPVLSVARNA